MNPSELLQVHRLRRTSCREGILEVILQAGEALSENDIRERLGGHYDRTTFYRSFKTLVDCHLLHRIMPEDQTVRYAVDLISQKGSAHPHHFCTSCHSVRCLNDVPMVKPELPEEFTAETTEMMIKGRCKACRNN
jgi:Fur family transcriptional regulator, ferric uptake regulator